jgi:hypothetical protein
MGRVDRQKTVEVSVMGDLTSRRLIVLKGLLFLLIAVMGAG